MSDLTVQKLPDVAIEALASHYHRYVKWTRNTGIPNFHGSIRAFYGSMISAEDLDNVDLCYTSTYKH